MIFAGEFPQSRRGAPHHLRTARVRIACRDELRSVGSVARGCCCFGEVAQRRGQHADTGESHALVTPGLALFDDHLRARQVEPVGEEALQLPIRGAVDGRGRDAEPEPPCVRADDTAPSRPRLYAQQQNPVSPVLTQPGGLQTARAASSGHWLAIRILSACSPMMTITGEKSKPPSTGRIRRTGRSSGSARAASGPCSGLS